MYRSLITSYFFCLITAFSALGSPIITVGTHDIPNVDQDFQIPIMVSSDTQERVEGLILYVQIGDGGLVNGGADTTPQITGLDLIGPGTIFNESNMGSTPFYLSADDDPPYLIALADTTAELGEDVEANGILAWLTVNPSGTTVGSSYRVSLQNVGENVPGGPYTTDFAGVPASLPIEDGWINIVPEPSVFLLLLTATGIWLCRRRFLG
jgi:hypothetical protein